MSIVTTDAQSRPRKTMQVVLKLADGRPRRLPPREVSLPYTFDGLSSNDNFLVFTMNYGFNCILGIPWLVSRSTGRRGLSNVKRSSTSAQCSFSWSPQETSFTSLWWTMHLRHGQGIVTGMALFVLLAQFFWTPRVIRILRGAAN